MPPPAKRKPPTHRTAANDIMHSLRELAHAVHDGRPLAQRFTSRTAAIIKSRD